MNDHILASDLGPRFVNSIFYSFHNFVNLPVYMKRDFKCSLSEQALHIFTLQTYTDPSRV